MTATLRQQADVVMLIGMNQAAHLKNLRNASRYRTSSTAEADIVEQRLPVLRDAYATLANLAKEAGE